MIDKIYIDGSNMTIGDMRQSIQRLAKGESLYIGGLRRDNWWYINPETENRLGIPVHYVTDKHIATDSLALIVSNPE